MLLKASGHDVRTAHDGPTALEAALDYRPDVVLLDIGLPGLNGYEVAKRMRQQPDSQEHRAGRHDRLWAGFRPTEFAGSGVRSPLGQARRLRAGAANPGDRLVERNGVGHWCHVVISNAKTSSRCLTAHETDDIGDCPMRKKKSVPSEVRIESPTPTDDASDTFDQRNAVVSFPIVGIGASAGGLEAFTQLLKALPLDTGMGFVLVQHLDPDHESSADADYYASHFAARAGSHEQPASPGQPRLYHSARHEPQHRRGES